LERDNAPPTAPKFIALATLMAVRAGTTCRISFPSKIAGQAKSFQA